MDALRPSHSLPTRASGLYEPHPRSRPPREARRNVDTQWGSLKRSARAVRAQCAHSATIWASGRTRDPYFEILGAPRGIMVTSSGGFDF